MIDADKGFTQVLTWRAEKIQIRVLQAVLVASLCWPATGVLASLVWVSIALGAAVIDWRLCQRALARPTDQPTLLAACASVVLSSAAFSSVAFPLLAQHSHVAVAEAALMLCAVNLNNAVMTRASRLSAGLILGPSAVVLLFTPLAAVRLGHHLTLTDIALLEIGAAAYLVFIGRLAATLQSEGETVRHALQDQDRQRRRAEFAMEEAVGSRARWRMLFDQSPLPQNCFNASRLHAALRPHIEAGDRRLGDAARVLFRDMTDALRHISVIDANEAAEMLFGIEEFGDKANPARLDEGYFSAFCEGLNGMDDDGVLAPFESRIVRRSGEMVDVRVHIRMPPGQEPPWSVCMVSYVDMTQARAAARAQQAAVEAAEQANRAKTEFLAVMSHEIRTPLNGVLGMAQAMELEPLSPAQKDRLGIIRQSGAALLDILNDVLDLSKIEAGKLELETVGFDLGAVARAARNAFEAVAAAKGLRLDVAVEPAAGGFYRGDAVRVRQVIYNLVANAVKFTEAGVVAIGVEACEGGVRISVRDTGIGIDADGVSRLFNKFVQADSSTTRRFGGTGLGLAICRELCQAMGGTIRVDSQVGVGSTFLVELPLGAAEAMDPAPMASGPAPAGGSTLRVLAAEDNEVNQLVLRTLLAQVGIAPMIVANGAEAVAAFEAGDWDLILMDVQMPEMDGPTAARAIRAREARTGAAATPIVALTANAMRHQLDEYRAAGMNGVLAKPIEVAQLYETLAAAAPREPVAERDVA